MKKQMAKMLAGGMVLGSLLTVGIGHASDYLETIDVYTKPLTITLNGQAVVSADQPNVYHNGTENVPATFQYKGTTYVPISFIAKEMNQKVAWDGESRTIALTDNVPTSVWEGYTASTLTETSKGKFTYTLENQTEKEFKMEFTSSQRYDFAVKNSEGDTVYLFSSVALFAQVLGEEILKQGETLSYEIDVNELGLEKGTYTLEVWLTPKEGKFSTVETDFVVE